MKFSSLWLATSSALLRHLKLVAGEGNRRSESDLDSTSREHLKDCFPGLDKSWFSSLAKNPKGFLKKALKEAQEKAKKKGDSYFHSGNICLPSSHLYECSCKRNGPHNRFSFFNTRGKMEDLIVDHVIKNFQSSVRILSFGSGGCLQELVLAARLAKAGVRSIYLALVEPDKAHANSYKDLVYFLRKMGEAYGIQIESESFEYITNVSSEEQFDVVYAIDCDDYKPCLDYSGRKLAHGEGNFDKDKTSRGNPYFVATGLIRAANLAIGTENALVLMSRGRDIISLTPKAYRSRLAELKNLSLSKIDYRSIDLFYLNADISNLLINLEHFINAKKPLLINRAILLEEDMDSVATFLRYHGVSCEFVDDAAVPERLEKIRGLVVDCTRFDWRRGEVAVPEVYSGRNVSVVRIDWVKSQRVGIRVGVYRSQTR